MCIKMFKTTLICFTQASDMQMAKKFTQGHLEDIELIVILTFIDNILMSFILMTFHYQI